MPHLIPREVQVRGDEPTDEEINEDHDLYVWGKRRQLWTKTLPGLEGTIDLFEWYGDGSSVNWSSFEAFAKRSLAVLDPNNCDKTGIDKDLAIEASKKFGDKMKTILKKPRSYAPFPGAKPQSSGSWIVWYFLFDLTDLILLGLTQFLHRITLAIDKSWKRLMPGLQSLRLKSSSRVTLTRRCGSLKSSIRCIKDWYHWVSVILLEWWKRFRNWGKMDQAATSLTGSRFQSFYHSLIKYIRHLLII